METNKLQTDRQTDKQTDGQTVTTDCIYRTAERMMVVIITHAGGSRCVRMVISDVC